MGPLVPPDFDPRSIVAVLAEHRVDYILIGGLAATAHGSPFLTQDVDITPSTDPENLQRLSDALRALQARVRAQGVEGGLPLDHDATSLAPAGVWNLTTVSGDLDISFRPSGTDGYRDLKRSATESKAFGVVIRLASLADIVRSKEAANRDKDQRVLPTLRDILAQRDTGRA